MTKNIIIKTSVQKRFDSFMAHGRVLFFSAPCGFGKTVLADALLRGRNVLRQSAADPDCAIPPSADCWPAASWQTGSPPTRGAPSWYSVNALPGGSQDSREEAAFSAGRPVKKHLADVGFPYKSKTIF